MSEPRMNEWGQPIGETVDGWTPRERPPRQPLTGRYCELARLSAASDAAALHAAFCAEPQRGLWTYLPYGPFASMQDYAAWLNDHAMGEDPLFYTIKGRDSEAPQGVAAFLRIDPAGGAIEVGHLCFSRALQRTRAATEAMYLMMRLVFDELGYRRYEWKCDALNAPSRAAAQRLGFQFEGIFRQATLYKGRSRDTAWLSVIDKEWPKLRDGFERWLDPNNFDERGVQRRQLGAF